ncbi:MAG: tetraacyldisaccharide 4'-kinase [Rickettsiales bacterium]|jgi:tetraacyldisaccharide 4'-kinase|nr:tetraacyldisaccharide 4'-kinase [Rickettsiales bacterium]
MLNFFAKKGLGTYLLLPFSWLFLLVIRVRQRLIRSHKFYQYSIVIGNATIGGGGKTPSALAIGRLLSDLGYNYNYLTKGYKGSISGPQVIKLKENTVAETGDEARLLAAQAPTYIAKKRHQAINFLKNSADDIIILDDGFQNLYLNCDLKILVIDENYLFGNELVLPAGPLRDTVAWHIEEADCIFFIRSLDLQIDDNIMKYISSKPVFYLKPKLISEIDLSKNYLVFSALANNAKFSTFLLANNVKISEVINYSDHHQYNNKDYIHIIDKARAKGLSILTTEKDAVKIDNKQLQDYKICQMRLEFIDQQDFINFIKKKLK